jgi:hypothetical protein
MTCTIITLGRLYVYKTNRKYFSINYIFDIFIKVKVVYTPNQKLKTDSRFKLKLKNLVSGLHVL